MTHINDEIEREIAEFEKQFRGFKYDEEMWPLKDFLRSFGHSIAAEAEKQTAKAYGGCSDCYGKGYSTVIERMTGRGEFDVGQGDVVIDRELTRYRPCTCDRGKQFAEAMEEAARRERERIEKVVKSLVIEPVPEAEGSDVDEYMRGVNDTVENICRRLHAENGGESDNQ